MPAARDYAISLKWFPARFTAGARSVTPGEQKVFKVTAWHARSGNFSTAGVVAGDILWLHNGDHSDIYTITGVNPTNVTVSANISQSDVFWGAVYRVEDISAYVEPGFAAQELVGEKSLFDFSGGDMGFRLRDKGNTIAQHALYSKLTQSTDTPEVSVTETLTDLSTTPMFYGYVEPSTVQRRGDAETVFSAKTMIAQMDTIDFGPARNGQAEVVSYSGRADALARKALIKGGNEEPGAFADVSISDQYLPDLGLTADWNWSKRTWRKTDAETDRGVSDLLPVTGVTGIHALMAREGRLYSVAVGDRSAITPTAISDTKVLVSEWGAATRNSATQLTVTSWRVTSAHVPCPVNFYLADVKVGDTIKIGAAWFTITAVNSAFSLSVSGTLPTSCNNGQCYKTLANAADVYRLHRFKGYSGGAAVECVALVRARSRCTYSVKSNQWSGPTKDLAHLATGFAVLIPGAQWVGIAAAIGANLALEGVSAATRTTQAIRNADQLWAVSYITILSLGDCTDNAVTGMGAAINMTVPLERTNNQPTYAWSDNSQSGGNLHPYVYTLADSVCTSQGNDGNWKGELWLARWDTKAGTSKVLRLAYTGTTWSVDPNVVGNADHLAHEPCGGMAASSKTVLVGVRDGFVAATLRSGGTQWTSVLMMRDRPPGRFITALDAPSGLNTYFTLGNDSDRYVKVVRQPTTTMVRPAELIYNSAPTDFKLVGSGPALTVSGDNQCSAIWHETLTDERTATFAGRLSAGVNVLTVTDDLCVYQLPEADSGDWRPPVMFSDGASNQTPIRMLTAASRNSAEHHLTDLYVTSNWKVDYIHHHFGLVPLTCREVLTRICMSSYSYLRVFNPAKPAAATEYKVFSRHANTPPVAGTISTAEAIIEPMETLGDAEYYDGFEHLAGNERITSGDVTAGARVYRPSSEWLTPCGARVLGARILLDYPQQSTNYPNMRRKSVVDVHLLSTGAPPSYKNLFERIVLTAHEGLSTPTLLLSLGFNGGTYHYSAVLMVWNANGVDWGSDEPSPVVTACPFYAETPTSAPSTPPTATRRLWGWNNTFNITATAQANPVDGPCVYAFAVNLKDHGANFAGFMCKLTRAGAEADSGLAVNVFSDYENHPGTEYPETRSLLLSPTQAVTAPGHLHVPPWPDTEPDTGYRYQLPREVVWLVVVLDRQDAGPVPITECPITWADALVLAHGRAYRINFADLGLPELPTLTWLTEWNHALATPISLVPDVQIVDQD